MPKKVKSTVRAGSRDEKVTVSIEAVNTGGGGNTINANIDLDITMATGSAWTHLSSSPAHTSGSGLNLTWEDWTLVEDVPVTFTATYSCTGGSAGSAAGTVTDNDTGESDTDSAGTSCASQPTPFAKGRDAEKGKEA